MTISRRQFLGGAAAVAGAAVLPAISGIVPAGATPASKFPGTLAPWSDLDPVAAGRLGYEIYKGRWNTAAGQSG